MGSQRKEDLSVTPNGPKTSDGRHEVRVETEKKRYNLFNKLERHEIKGVDIPPSPLSSWVE